MNYWHLAHSNVTYETLIVHSNDLFFAYETTTCYLG